MKLKTKYVCVQNKTDNVNILQILFPSIHFPTKKLYR